MHELMASCLSIPGCTYVLPAGEGACTTAKLSISCFSPERVLLARESYTKELFSLAGLMPRIHCVTPATLCKTLHIMQGSGISEGEYVTLGANEVEDLSCLVDFIRAGGHTTTLALWGRSMGAVTALLYSERDPSVAGLVLDSPFSKLTDLMRELAQEQRIPLWSMVGGTALKLMRRSAHTSPGCLLARATASRSTISHVRQCVTPSPPRHASSSYR